MVKEKKIAKVRQYIELAILASQDTDLEPALDEALVLGRAKVHERSGIRKWIRQPSC